MSRSHVVTSSELQSLRDLELMTKATVETTPVAANASTSCIAARFTATARSSRSIDTTGPATT